ncbi:hypothetical protein DICSQDRAFT_103273 [Dichomitus squalens LYAD-421 SS1]|uniref:uncharacterized protein n=1 Tax=Dichomitus squalens (strain LYAD-421) TaxID=732165 RepID=UPI00044142C6|nr:uncharacterized protein DICSQDRAFT_103273 [Dichomitus squalens LYAD-421 SS1]EJF62914.1 hypothetical protein DICSQDRAFT_103273 [Dichomitus squalens LYAD-421 SS1]
MGHADLYAHQFTNELSQPSIPPANSASLESKSSDLNARTGLDSPRELTLPPGGLGSDPPLASMRVGIPHDLTTTGDEVSMSGCPSSPGLLLSQISSLSLDANEFGGAGDHNEDANKLDSGSMCARDSASLPEVEDAVHSSAIDCVTACHGFSLPCESLPAEDSTLSVIASSPPSSSPPCPSSSQPQSLYDTPPSSSPPVEAPWDVDCGLTSSSTTQVDVSASLGTTSKRALEIDESDDEHRPRKRTRSDSVSDRSPPQPIRPTPASQAKQYKKLAAPFRSPVIKGPLVQGGLHAVYASGRAASMVVRKLPEDENIAKPDVSVEPASLVANKDRTAKAAKQFKSPVQPTSPNTVTSSKFTPASGTFSRIGAAPTIQALQGQVQTLKQAIKIKNSGDRDEDQVLEQLVEKWTEVGREVAWAVWGYVKDLDPGPGEQQKSGWFADEDEVKAGRKRGFDSNWGYGEEPARKKGKTESDAEAESTEDVEPPVVQHTVGVMLRRLGIDPDTLGWNEDEGDFVDV